ncbi:MAG: WG repeat-containing protein [Labilithrix sp.]|nr:WG repeat-containing protein [Labilithrix sp.]MCW5813339.1 WG repeat-containing protein [Labilithrix sp.]
MKILRANGKFGFQDEQGKVLVTPKYDHAVEPPEGEGLGIVCLGGGLCDRSDNHEPTRLEHLGGKWGAVDERGDEVVPLEYDELGHAGHRILIANRGARIGLLDERGTVITPIEYSWIAPFSEGLAMCRRAEGEQRNGYLDTTGAVAIPCEYADALTFSEGRALVADADWNHGVLDRAGRAIIPCLYERHVLFKDGIAVVKRDGKYGIVDEVGAEVVPCIYEAIGQFSEARAAFKLDGKWGYLNHAGEMVIAARFDDYLGGPSAFDKGRARVRLNGRELFINNKGAELNAKKPPRTSLEVLRRYGQSDPERAQLFDELQPWVTAPPSDERDRQLVAELLAETTAWVASHNSYGMPFAQYSIGWLRESLVKQFLTTLSGPLADPQKGPLQLLYRLHGLGRAQ